MTKPIVRPPAPPEAPNGVKIKRALIDFLARGIEPTAADIATVTEWSAEQIEHKLCSMRGDILCHENLVTGERRYSLYGGVA